MNCVLVLSLQSFRRAMLPLKIPQPAHLSAKLSAICQAWLCRAPQAHGASPVAIQPLCQPAAWTARDFNKPEPLSASHKKIYCIKLVYYWWAPSHLTDKTWLLFITTLFICQGYWGLEGQQSGVYTQIPLEVKPAKRHRHLLFPCLQPHSSYMLLTLLLHTPICQTIEAKS